LLHDSDPTILESKINIALNKLQQWTTDNMLTVNPKKPSVLIIPPKRTTPVPNLQVKYGNDVIALTECIKYLGIWIDSRLTFVNHVNTLEKKLSRSLGIMFKLKKVLSSKALSMIYYSLVHPHLLYGISVWGGIPKSNLKRLQTIQNKAIKIIGAGNYFDKATPYFVKRDVLKISEIYQLEIAKLMFRLTHYSIPFNFKQFFTTTSSVHTKNTRSTSNYSLNYYIPRFGTNKLQQSFRYQGVKVWNSIPNHFKQKMTFSLFKKKLKKYLIDQY